MCLCELVDVMIHLSQKLKLLGEDTLMILYPNIPLHARASLGLKCGQCTGSLYLVLKFNIDLEKWGERRIKL